MFHPVVSYRDQSRGLNQAAALPISIFVVLEVLLPGVLSLSFCVCVYIYVLEVALNPVIRQ